MDILVISFVCIFKPDRGGGNQSPNQSLTLVANPLVEAESRLFAKVVDDGQALGGVEEPGDPV
jgi:hypothetical protein